MKWSSEDLVSLCPKLMIKIMTLKAIWSSSMGGLYHGDMAEGSHQSCQLIH